jgi:hypothetical protein
VIVMDAALTAIYFVATEVGAGAGVEAGAGAGAAVGTGAGEDVGACVAEASGLLPSFDADGDSVFAPGSLPTPLLAPSPPLRKSLTYQPEPLS